MRGPAVALVWVASAAAHSCSWTDPASGKSWNLDKLVAKDHYDFRGLIGDHDSLHTSGATTGVAHYEDNTYVLNLCKEVTNVKICPLARHTCTIRAPCPN